MHWGISVSTMGMYSTPGDIMSTLGDTLSTPGDIMRTSEAYYHEYAGRYSVYRRDTMSTQGGCSVHQGFYTNPMVLSTTFPALIMVSP